MPDVRKRVVGDDGELLVEAAPRQGRLLRWVLLSSLLGLVLTGIVVASEWSKGPGKPIPVYYRARLAETSGAANGRCMGWNLWGVVDRPQAGMIVRAQSENDRLYEGRVHTDIHYQLLISPPSDTARFKVVLIGADGSEWSAPYEVRLSNSQCVVRLDFDGVD